MSAPAGNESPPRGRSRVAIAAAGTTIAAVLVLGACGGGASGHDAPAAASPPTGAGGHTANTPCVVRPGSVCLTERARGHTVRLKPGWTLTLRLGAPGRTFSAPRQYGGDVLETLGRTHRSGSELIAGFRAVRAGTAQLRATERPVCRSGAACPDFIALWTLTVVVEHPS